MTHDTHRSPTMATTEPTPPAPAPRAASRFATYRGDVTAELLAAPVMGPNLLNEHLTVVEATFDEQGGTTRAGFAYTTTHDLARHPLPLAAQRVMAELDHPALFTRGGRP